MVLTSDLARLLPEVERLAREAGEHILAVDAGRVTVSHKADDSPLTAADLASHRHLAAGLQDLAPEIPYLSEEGGDIPWATRRGWRRYWLVDPLDGTREFLKRNGEYAVSIALVEDGVPVLGVVHGPARDECYAAAQGLGAWKTRRGQRQPIRCRPCPERPVVLVSRSHHTAATDALYARLPPHERLSRGSALKAGMVAEGAADLYPRLGPTSEWDTAAGQCIVEAAGGAVLRLPDGQPLRYNQQPGLINPDFLILGDPGLDWRRWLPPPTGTPAP